MPAVDILDTRTRIPCVFPNSRASFFQLVGVCNCMINRKATPKMGNTSGPATIARELLRYGLAVALVLLTVWIRVELESIIQTPVLILFILPIFLSAWAGAWARDSWQPSWPPPPRPISSCRPCILFALSEWPS